jgi:hypothetical protein
MRSRIIFGIAYLLLVLSTSARAYDDTGVGAPLGPPGINRIGKPSYEHVPADIRKWFRSQKNPKTGVLCCDESDGVYAEEDIRDGSYWTRWPQNPEWMRVPDEVVIRDPNRHGAPVVWWLYENGKPVIRCFAPGGGV